MLQGKEVAKYFKNLPNFNIREDSEEPLSVNEMRYVLYQCR